MNNDYLFETQAKDQIPAVIYRQSYKLQLQAVQGGQNLMIQVLFWGTEG